MGSTSLMPLEEAYSVVDAQVSSLRVGTEVIPVRTATGRFLATDQASKLDLPPFNKSAMDGYAVMAEDERDAYKVIATIPAGYPCEVDLTPGTAVKVMTGAPVPASAGKVIMVEDTNETDGVVHITQHKQNSNISAKAEDIHIGQVIMQAGTCLDAVAIANLIGCGISEVEVSKPVRVAIISTGDELVDDASEIQVGKIMNTNGPLLAGLAEQYGLVVTNQLQAKDDIDSTKAAILQALGEADMVLLSGGVSAGDYDYVPDVIKGLGLDIHFQQLAVKPGKPTLFATGGGKVLFGLPGNPAAVYLAFHTMVLRAAALLSGTKWALREISLPLAKEYTRRKASRSSFEPACISSDGQVVPCEYHGSAHLAALITADGLMQIPSGVKQVNAGESVGFIPLKLGWRDA